MPSKLPLFVAVALAVTSLAGCMAVSVALAPTPVTLATGVPGGIYHPVGNAICRLFNLVDENQATPCVALGSDGSVANMYRLEAGEATFALSQTDVVYAAFHGEGPFAAAGPNPNLRILISLYPEIFTVVARADGRIVDFADLLGKQVGIGRSGGGYTFTRDVVLRSHGLSMTDSTRVLELGPAEQNHALCNNEVDAIIFEAGHPNGLTQEVTTNCRTRLVRVVGPPIDRLLAVNPHYIAAVVPGGMYAGNPNDVPTIGTQAIVVTTADLADDLAYAMVRAVFENLADFRRLHPALGKLNAQEMVPSKTVIPIHPGALRYFRETSLVR
jgi:TRAP transporter TAXI family solute receptor